MHVYGYVWVYVCVCVYAVFCPGYLEWWLDSTMHLVLFIQYILNSVSVAYICYIREVVNLFKRWLIYLRGG